MPTINMQATGLNMKKIMKQNHKTVSQIQNGLGFNTPQAIYKWLRGDSLPTIDNIIIFAFLCNVKIDDIIILN